MEMLSPTLLISLMTLLPDKAEVWLDFGRSASISRNSRKSGSARSEGWAAVLLMYRSKAARRLSMNWKKERDAKLKLEMIPRDERMELISEIACHVLHQ